jgi:hypothetical protein
MSLTAKVRRLVQIESGGAYTTALGVDVPIVDRVGPFDSVAAAADWIAARYPDAVAVERGDFRIIETFPVI